MRVTLVTTWNAVCGVSEHAAYLKEAIEQADPEIEVTPETNLHPDGVDWHTIAARPDWVWLNYHAALHSQWTPGYVQELQARKVKVGVTYHDTGVPNSDQCKALHAVADCFVIHEPADDLPGAVYLRQGIPDWSWEYQFLRTNHNNRRPIVGTLGFPFPWKNVDLLVEASALAGWAVCLLTPNATPEQVARWTALNPHSYIEREFIHRTDALAMLSGCDATAFLYANANTGTSAAIRLGVAARKPVIASSYDACRQFRDLWLDLQGSNAILWQDRLTVESVAQALACVRPGPFDGEIVRLAAQDSWQKVGQVYAKLLRGESL